jgi:uncharacterized surface protein with fasciclin (FAS1) repeats
MKILRNIIIKWKTGRAEAGSLKIPFGLAIIFLLCIYNCRKQEPQETFYKEEELLISAYLESRPNEFSTLTKVLHITGLEPVLNAYGHYTFFAPDNEAFKEFCSSQGISSVDDLDKNYLTSLVKYHLLNKDLESNFLPNGVLADTNYTGDNLVFSFLEGGLHSITINNEATITEYDIKVANGHINRLNRVLSPVFLSTYDIIESDSRYKIFGQALRETGLMDTLSIINVPAGPNHVLKNRFTIFAEPDSVFISNGISNFANLKAKYDDSGMLTEPSNGLYRFIAYHCLPGLYYLNQLDSFNYQTLSDNEMVGISISDDIYLNYYPDENTAPPLNLDRNRSNRSCKNGVIHSLNGLLEIHNPVPKYYLFDFSTYQGINIGETYFPEDLKYLNGLKTENTGIWYRMSMLDEDSSYLETTSNKVGWSVEFRIPPIAKGIYRVVLHWVSTQNRSSSVQTFWDEAVLGDEFAMIRSKRPPQVPPEWLYDFHFDEEIGQVFLENTTAHTMKFIGLAEGYGDWDYVEFIPLN